MAYKTLRFRITGVRPLLMHNGALANPLNHFSKAIKAVSSKRNKTDADHEEMARLEFLGGLWLDKGEPCIPSEAIESCFTSAARKNRQGKQAQAGVIVPEHACLQYEGPRSPEEMWKTGDWESQGGMAFVSMVRVQRNKIARTRCRFDEWSAEFDLQYRDDLMNESEVISTMSRAGEQCGLGDWVPKFGLFMAERV